MTFIISLIVAVAAGAFGVYKTPEGGPDYTSRALKKALTWAAPTFLGTLVLGLLVF